MRAAILLGCLMLVAGPARAEYAELGMAKGAGAASLAGLGAAGLALDVLSVRYLARGPGPERGRKIVAALQAADAVLLVASAMTWHGLARSSVQGPDGVMNAITGAHLVLGAASLGLGIATYASHRRPERPVLAVAPLAGGGVAVSAAGRF